MFNKVAESGLKKLQKKALKKLSTYPEGETKDKWKKVLDDFVPAFKQALKDGDVNKLLELKRDVDAINKGKGR